MSNKAISVYTQALRRQEEEKNTHSDPKPTRKRDILRDNSHKVLRKKPRGKLRDMPRDNLRYKSRDKSRDSSRVKSRDLPSRDVIQEFSFHLRDETEVKVQAEIPHQWHTELTKITQHLNVKKIELYRFIYAEFLGKAQRKKEIQEGDGKNK